MIWYAVDRARLEALRAGDAGAFADAVAFAVTPALLAAHDYGPKESEDAEYVVLGHAGVASLGLGPRRWVAVCEGLTPGPGGTAYGRVPAPAPRWEDVTALFTDEPDAGAAMAALHERVAGRPLEEVLAEEAVLTAAEAYDLLWYAPQELDRIG